MKLLFNETKGKNIFILLNMASDIIWINFVFIKALTLSHWKYTGNKLTRR